MKAQELYEIVFKKAQEFGMRPKNEFRTIQRPREYDCSE